VQCAGALEDKVVIVADVYGGGGESDLAAGVTKFPNGQEWFVGQGQYNVANVSGMW